MIRRLVPAIIIALSAQGLCDEQDLQWKRRALRGTSASGYLGVVHLDASPDATKPRAALVCEQEGVSLHVDGARWVVTAADGSKTQGDSACRVPSTLFVKRTPQQLLLGLNGQWIYGCAAPALADKPAVRVGTAAATVALFQLVPREPVRFDDDFPDPVPHAGRWAAVRGRWALSSLSSPEHSANPAELAALFDNLEDAASLNRTRTRHVGVGVVLGGANPPIVVRIAADSPAERAGIRYGDRLRKVDGVDVKSVAAATAAMAGEEGQKLTVTVEREGKQLDKELRREMVLWGRSRRQVVIDPYVPDDAALMVAGDPFWTDYRFTCAVRTQHVGAFGLVFAYQDPRNYHVFRWASAQKVASGGGRWMLQQVRDGQSTVLAEREGGFSPRDFYSYGVSLSGDTLGQIQAECLVDGVAVLQCKDDSIVPGKIGFWAEAPGAVCFDDVVVVGEGAQVTKDTTGTRSRTQRLDQHMKAWGNPAYAWTFDSMGNLWWHRDDFPGDVTLASPIGAGSQTQPFRLVASATRGKPTSGYAFECDLKKKTTSLQRDGKVLAEKPLGDLVPKKATLARTGHSITLQLDGKPWLQATDKEPPTGAAVVVSGVALSGWRPSTDVTVAAPSVVEYFFNGAPTDWHVMHGYWEVMNRWMCDPRWSFFGGRADGALAIWNKRRLEGDVYADAFVGPMMFDRSASYENLRDLGLTICGDGRNLASGYTLIVGANRNQVTALFRNGRIVASRRDRGALIPTHSFSGSGTVFPSRHRGWLPIKLVKQGHSIEAYLFGTLILTYHDAQPIAGGYTAIWSVNNGLLLAKARLAATRVSAPQVEPFLRRHRPFLDAALSNDCGNGEASIVANGSEYEIVNTAGGGPFAVAFHPRVYSARQRPVISFDIKLTDDARIDLYLTCRGTPYRVVVAGPPEEDGGAKTLGIIEGVKADGQWHTVSFDLLDALQKEHPDDPLLMVWDARLANHATKGYLVAGFGGNGAGARYWLRNVSIPDSPRAAQAPSKPSDT